MKRLTTALACGLAVVLTFGLSAMAIRQALACDSCGGCGQTDMVVWAVDPSSTNALGCSGSTASFNVDLCFEWVFQSPPTLGESLYTETGSSHIASVTYNPSLLTNPDECCTGSVTVNASGTLDTKTQDATLKTKGYYWPPFRQAYKIITINHCP